MNFCVCCIEWCGGVAFAWVGVLGTEKGGPTAVSSPGRALQAMPIPCPCPWSNPRTLIWKDCYSRIRAAGFKLSSEA